MLIPEQTLIAILAAFIIAILLTPTLRLIAVRQHWLDEPNHRTSHLAPTPRLGGVAFIVGTVVGVAIGMPMHEPWLFGVTAGALLLAFTGLLDDLQPLSALKKLTPQVLAAAIAVISLDPYIFIDLPFSAVALHPTASRALAVVWIVSLVNAFNFLDGLDGLAAGVATISAVALATITDGTVIMVLLPFAAAVAGFLVWNFEPASIFMGDVGSQFAGYILAVSVFMPVTLNAGAVPVLFVFAPVLTDALVTILRRIVLKQSLFQADQNHVFHGIVRQGYSHRAVATLYYALTAIGAVAAVSYMYANALIKGALLMITTTVIVYLVVRLVNKSIGDTDLNVSRLA